MVAKQGYLNSKIIEIKDVLRIKNPSLLDQIERAFDN